MPSEALAKEGRSVWYVYLIASEAFVGERYIGITSDLRRRIAEHHAGKSSHTSKFLPRRIVTYMAFQAEQRRLRSSAISNRDPGTRSPANVCGSGYPAKKYSNNKALTPVTVE